MTDTMGTDTNVSDPGSPILPPGVHPLDNSEPLAPGFGSTPAAPPDTVGNRYGQGAPPWKTDNDGAIAVFQRASHDWSVQIVVVDANNAGSAIAIGRQKGRQRVTLSVPTTLPNGTTPLGVVFGPTADSVESGINSAGVLNPGDSVSIATEAGVYIGVIPGNATGACQVLGEYNPPGGSFGGQ